MREDHAETLRYEDLKINNNSSDEDLVLGKLDRNDEEMLETPRPPDTGVKDFGNEKEKAKETVKEKENSVKEEEKDFQIIVLVSFGFWIFAFFFGLRCAGGGVESGLEVRDDAMRYDLRLIRLSI